MNRIFRAGARHLYALLLCVPLLLSASASVSAAPVTFNTALPVSQGEGIVRVQAKYLSATDDPGTMNRELHVKALPFIGVWGITSRWTLFGIAPLLDKNMQLDSPAGRLTRQVNGLADMTAMLRYTAYRHDQSGRTLRLAPFLGITLPTGKDDEQDSLGQLPGSLQLGSGTWNALIGMVATAQSLQQEWALSGSYQFNRVANRFERGDEARLDLSWHRRIWINKRAQGLPHFLYAGIEGNGLWQGKHRSNGQDDADSGGTTLYLAPTLQYITRRSVIEWALQRPMLQNLNGMALRQDFIVTLSLRVNY